MIMSLERVVEVVVEVFLYLDTVMCTWETVKTHDLTLVLAHDLVLEIERTHNERNMIIDVGALGRGLDLVIGSIRCRMIVETEAEKETEVETETETETEKETEKETEIEAETEIKNEVATEAETERENEVATGGMQHSMVLIEIFFGMYQPKRKF